MKLKKENVYVDLRGKSKEELNLITEITEVENLKNYYYLHFYTPLNKWIRYHVWTDNIENKTEVTIEQLKEILQPKEMTRNQELREEAKKRGYTHDNFKCLKGLKHSSNPNLDKWYYEGCTDTLYSNSCGNGGKIVYRKGVWAEMIKPIETFTPIAMRCTQEQFEAIKPKLKGLKIWCIDSFSVLNYLTNNLGEQENLISNVMESSKGNYNRTVHEEWNEEIFLKACGIETKNLELNETLQPMENKEEQLRKEAIKRGFVNGVKFYGSEGAESDEPMLINDNIKYMKPGDGNWGLYVENSWLCFNGKWGTLIEESLEQQLQKAKAEVERLEKEIEESKIKVGDLVKCTNKESRAKCVIGVIEDLHPGYVGVGGHWYDKFEKVTDPILLESLNKLF